MAVESIGVFTVVPYEGTGIIPLCIKALLSAYLLYLISCIGIEINTAVKERVLFNSNIVISVFPIEYDHRSFSLVIRQRIPFGDVSGGAYLLDIFCTLV